MQASGERRLKSASGEVFPMQTTVWKKGGTRLLGGYFFFQRGRVITSPWMNKYWLMVDAFARQRTDGALVRIEMTLAPGQSVEEAYGILEKFVREVYAVLPEYVPV
jgi:EpsI family protein